MADVVDEPFKHPLALVLIIDLGKWLEGKRAFGFIAEVVERAANAGGEAERACAFIEDADAGVLVLAIRRCDDVELDGFTSAGRTDVRVWPTSPTWRLRRKGVLPDVCV